MSADHAVEPLHPAERVALLDVMRGIAVCGILAVNILVMGTVAGTQGRTFPASRDADWIAWIGQRLLLEGAMRGLFTILFGAGMVMMLRKAEGPDAQVVPIDVWARRSLVLLALGVVHFTLLLWPGEILWTYGLAGLALLAFRTAKVRTLWIWALIIVAALSLHRAYDTSSYVATYQTALEGERVISAGGEPTVEQQAAMDAASSANTYNYPDAEVIAEEIGQRTTFPNVLWWSASGWSFRHLGVYSWIGVAESLAFMLVGMALYRSGLLTGGAPARTYWMLLLIGGGIGLGLRAVDLAWQARTGFELDIHRLNATMSLLRSGWYQPARLALTLAYVGLFALLLRGGARGWTPPFSAMGRLALTSYTLQSALASILFYGLAYLGYFGTAGLMGVTLGICIITALFSLAWLRRFSIGPLEWLLRVLAYGTFSLGRRRQAADAISRSPPL